MAAAIKHCTHTYTHRMAHNINCGGQHGAYATPLPSPVVVNSAKLFATLSRKMVNFVDGDELKLETQILKTRQSGASTTRHEAQCAVHGARGMGHATLLRQPSSKGLSSHQKSGR